MKKQTFLYKTAYKYSTIIQQEKHIVLKDKQGYMKASYSRDGIISIINEYGKNLYKILKKNSFDKEISVKDNDSITEIFKKYFKYIGYVRNNSKDIIIDDYNIVYISYDTIMDLKNKFIKFYLLYELYNMLGSFPLKPLQLKRANEYIKIFNPNFEDLTISNSDCLYGEVMELISEQFKYTLKLKFELVNNDFITFNVISTDIYALALYAFSDIISLNELNQALTFTCENCHKKAIRKSNNQKYCSNCREKINYNKNSDNNKIDIINEILRYKNEKNYYVYWDADFQIKFDEKVALLKQSRKRLNTNISELKAFHQEVLKKVRLRPQQYAR